MSEDGQDEKDVVLLVPEDTQEDWTFAEADATVVRLPRQRYDEVVAMLQSTERVRVNRPRPTRKDAVDAA